MFIGVTRNRRCNYENLRTCLCNFFMYNMYIPASFCDVLFVSKTTTLLSRQRISCIYDFVFSIRCHKHDRELHSLQYRQKPRIRISNRIFKPISIGLVKNSNSNVGICTIARYFYNHNRTVLE